MKNRRWWIATAIALVSFAQVVFAQDKPKPQEQQNEEFRFTLVSLRVQLVFTEYEGDKKIKSLPYTFLVTTHTRDGRPESKIRIGNRVPVYTGPGQNSWQYMDVGTNIDSWAEGVAPGQYRVYLYLERSWIEGDKAVPVEGVAGSSEHPDATRFPQPIIRQYKAELTPILRDGQSLETQLATDPLSGRVVKLEVSISVLK